jgi:hypothetical protein
VGGRAVMSGSSFGLARNEGRQPDAVDRRYCQRCGITLTRRQFPSGAESWAMYGRRQYCSVRCRGLVKGSGRQFVAGVRVCAGCGTTFERRRAYVDAYGRYVQGEKMGAFNQRKFCSVGCRVLSRPQP